MAIAFDRVVAQWSTKNTGTGLILSWDGLIPAGAVIVAFIASDNATATTPTVTIAKDSGETNDWVLVGTIDSPQSGSNAGVIGHYFAIQTTQQWDPALTATLSESKDAKGVIAISFTGATVTGVVGGDNNTNTITTGSVSAGAVVVGFAATESNTAPTGDTDTTNGSWSSAMAIGTTGGGAASNVFLVMQYKIATGTGTQTYNVSSVSDGGIGYVVLSPGGPTQHPVTGTVAVTSTASGSPKSQQAVSGTVTVVSVVTGTAGQFQSVSGTVPATSTTSGAVALAQPVSGTASSTSTASGTIALAFPVSGTAVASSTASGTVTALLTLSGTADATSTASGAVELLAALSGTADATSTASGSIALLAEAAGTVPVVSTASGTVELVEGQTFPVDGTVVASSTASGEIGLSQPVEGTVTSTSASSGVVALLAEASGTVAATSTASGEIALLAEAAGTVQVVSTATGTIQLAGIAALLAAHDGYWDFSDAASVTESGGVITSIADQNGGETLTGYNSPLYDTLNGLGAMLVNRLSNQAVESNTLGTALTPPYTVWIVLRRGDTDAATQNFAGHERATIRSVSNEWFIDSAAGFDSNVSSTDTNTHIIIAVFDGGFSSAIRIDGADPITGGNPGTENIVKYGLGRNAYSGGTEPASGRIGEAGVYDGIMGSADQVLLRDYLAEKWGVNLGQAQAVSGTVVVASTVSGTADGLYTVAGTVAASSTATGEIGLSQPVSGTVTASSTASGEIGVSQPVSGSVTATSAASGEIVLSLAVSGTVAATSTASGSVTFLALGAGTVASTSTVSGTIAVAFPLLGTVAVSSTASGTANLLNRYTNTAETGLADGTNVTVANSDDGAAGDPFSAISVAGGPIEYNNVNPMQGSLSHEYLIGSSGATYSRFATGLAGTTMAGRVYLRVALRPTGNTTIVRALNGSTAAMLQLRVTSAGIPVFLNGGGTVVATGATALATGSWYRFEFWVTPGTTTSTGRCSIDIYPLHDTTGSLLHYDSTTANNGTAQTPRLIEVGRSGTANGAITVFADDYAIDDTIGEAYIGPSGSPSVFGTAVATSTATGTIAVQAALSGTVASSSTASGTIGLLASAAGTVPAASTVTGSVGQAAALTGSVPAESTASGSVALAQPLAGSVDAVSTTTGTAGALTGVSGTVTIISTTVGSVAILAFLVWYWDGAAKQPAELLGVWNGTSIDPASIVAVT